MLYNVLLNRESCYVFVKNYSRAYSAYIVGDNTNNGQSDNTNNGRQSTVILKINDAP